jgi:chromosomal replication initiation ATPase DnaA
MYKVFVYFCTTCIFINMNKDRDLEDLLKNIQEGLKKFTIKELNDAIVEFFNKKDDKTKEIYYILEIVSEEFKTNVRHLKKKNVRGDLSDAKQISYCLLHFKLGLSTRYISEKVFSSNWHSVVHKAILRFKNANLSLKPDREFVEIYNKLSEKFIDNFTQKNKTLEYGNQSI